MRVRERTGRVKRIFHSLLIRDMRDRVGRKRSMVASLSWGWEGQALGLPLPPGIMLPLQQPIGPSNEMPVIPASGRPMQASMSAAEAPVGGPIVPRRPQRPALAPAQLPETGAPLNRIAAATQAATAPAPGPGAMLAIGPALPTVPRQVTLFPSTLRTSKTSCSPFNLLLLCFLCPVFI